MRFVLLSFGLLVGLFAIVQLGAIKFPVFLSAKSPLTPNPVEEPVLSSGSSSKYSNKLGASLRLRLSRISAEESAEDNARVNVLLRTSGPLTPEQQAQLEATGAEVRTVAGDIVTASIRLRQSLAVAELTFVSYIELSQSLFPESP
jgi:hypothetical protein